MTPFYFGERTRRLFGLYTPARVAAIGTRARGVVICPPWGQEYLRAHRSMRQLGAMLADAGRHVLRFDYFGTGDSAGEITETEVSGWQDDIATAIEELKDTASLERVALVGLRMGGTLAALAAARRWDVDMLALWDPVVTGREFLAELSRNNGGPPVPRVAGTGGVEVLGFPITASQWLALEALELPAQVAGLTCRTLVALSSRPASYDSLASRLNGTQGDVVIETLDGFPAWIEDSAFRAGAIPVKILERITEWLA